MPPIPCCGCWLCTKRRGELMLAMALELEMHDPDVAARDKRPSGNKWAAWRDHPSELPRRATGKATTAW